MTKRYHLLYKVTCIPTGKFYIGMHSTNSLADGYMGSGKIIRSSVRKYGKVSHTFEILEHCADNDGNTVILVYSSDPRLKDLKWKKGKNASSNF